MTLLRQKTSSVKIAPILWLLAVFLFQLSGSAPAQEPDSSFQNLSASLNTEKIRYLPFTETQKSYGLSLINRRLPYLKLKLNLSREVNADYETGWVTLTEKTGPYSLYRDSYLPIDRYLSLHNSYELDKAWQQDLRLGLTKEEQEKAGGLIKYEIPIKFPKALRSIIGEGGPGLRVNGYRKISFSGRSEWDSGVTSTAMVRQSKFPQLHMEQTSKFTITGTVGSKVTVKVDQDSQRDTELANRIEIRYKGEEDEIVQSVEMGNTNLSLPNTQFVGYSENVQGLFGIKATAKMGNLDITAITSQEKGSTEKTTFTAGAHVEPRVVRDYDYLKRTWFYLGPTSGDKSDTSTALFRRNDTQITADLYAHDYQVKQTDLLGKAVVSPRSKPNVTPEEEVRNEFYYGSFRLLDPQEYELAIDSTNQQLYVMLNRSLSEHDALAAYIVKARTIGSRVDTIVVGDLDYHPDPTFLADTTLLLMLIKHPEPDTNFQTWDYEWRNIYSLGGRNVSREGFELRIYKGTAGQENVESDPEEQNGVPYLQILGLDLKDQAGNPNPDGIVDYEWLRFYHGVVIFPHYTPFNTNHSFTGRLEDVLEQKVPEIYKSTETSGDAQRASKYYLNIKTSSRETRYSLGHTNIIEGSEVVMLNGRRLVRGKDYNMSYDFGQITFLTEESADPNANISVDYEYSPFFMPEKKTLFGIRTVYNLKENSWIGATALYKKESAGEHRPRVGREPSRNLVWDTDLALKFEPSFLTKMVDALPLVETEAPSSVDISAEFAQSRPKPNLRNEAFIDDFEGSRDWSDLSIRRGAWTICSPPPGIQLNSRVPIRWYNPYDQVRISSIWPEKKEAVREADDRTNILILQYFPQDSTSWAGLMRSLFVGAHDQTLSRFLEVWLKPADTTETIILNVDLGKISEDIDADGIYDTEDKLRNGQRDGILDDDEDTGLDTLFSALEPGYDPNTNPDPSGDDWNYDDKRNYSQINGTERNREDPERGRTPDTEDINNNGGLDTENSYFHFSINLNAHEFQTDQTSSGWRLYRVPLKDSLLYEKVGNANWTYVEFARLWLTGAEYPTACSLATIELVGNKWQDLGISPADSLSPPLGMRFGVTSKNTQENADYISPPGIEGELDRSTRIREKEEALVLQFENLYPGHTAKAYRFMYSAEDYTNYGKMTMFVAGLGDFAPEGMSFFFRMGQDTLNYYESRTPLYVSSDPSQPWDERNFMEIDFAQITALKNYMLMNLPDTVLPSQADTLDLETGYRVHGDPSLSKIQWFIVGVTVSDSALTPLTGEVWLNELRVTDVRDNADWAGRMSVSASLADLGTFSASYQRVGADFHGLLTKKGTGAVATSKQLRASLNLHKFLPPSWGVSLPVSGSWSNTLQLPRLKPGSDIVLPEELRYSERTENSSYTFNISESVNRKGANWLTDLTLNRISTSYSWSQSKSRNPTTPSSKLFRYTLTGNYDLSPRKEKSLSIFGWTKTIFLLKKLSDQNFSYFPSNLKFSGTANSAKNRSLSRAGTETYSYNRDLTLNLSGSYSPVKCIRTTYTAKSQRDIRPGPNFQLSWDPKKLKLGREFDFTQSADLSYQPKLTTLFDTRFTYSASYHENSDLRQHPDSTRSIDNGTTRSVDVSFNWQNILRGGRPPSSRKAEEAEPAKKYLIGSPAWIWERLKYIAKNVDPIGVTFSRQKSFAYSGLTERPGWAYQLGFKEDPGVPRELVEQRGQRDSRSFTDSYSIRSGFSPFSSADVDLSYSRRDNTARSTTEPTRTVSTTFPDLNISLTGVEKISFLNKIASSSSVSSGYSKKVDETSNPDTEQLNKKDVSTRFSPLFSWSLNWKNGVRTSLRMEKSESKSEDLRPGSSGVATSNFNNSVNFGLSYSFKSPKGIKLPLFGRIRFQSTLTLNLDATRSHSVSETARPGQPFNTESDRIEFSLQPQASYSFSSSVTGGMSMRWTDTNDKKKGTKHHVRELGLWMELRF
jgi:hypothetical protein